MVNELIIEKLKDTIIELTAMYLEYPHDNEVKALLDTASAQLPIFVSHKNSIKHLEAYLTMMLREGQPTKIVENNVTAVIDPTYFGLLQASVAEIIIDSIPSEYHLSIPVEYLSKTE